MLPVFYEPSDEADDVHAQLLARRVVLLTGSLDAAAADDASARLLLLHQRGEEPITLHMSCPDGELDATLSLVATIDLIGADVHAVAAGGGGGGGGGAVAAAGQRRGAPPPPLPPFAPPAGPPRGARPPAG